METQLLMFSIHHKSVHFFPFCFTAIIMGWHGESQDGSNMRPWWSVSVLFRRLWILTVLDVLTCCSFPSRLTCCWMRRKGSKDSNLFRNMPLSPPSNMLNHTTFKIYFGSVSEPLLLHVRLWERTQFLISQSYKKKTKRKCKKGEEEDIWPIFKL